MLQKDAFAMMIPRTRREGGMTVARDIPRPQRTAGRKQEEPRRKAGQKKRARLHAHPWPVGGTLWSLACNRLASHQYLRVSRLLRPRPFPLDLLVKTPEEIAQALDRDDAFMRAITVQGRVLYERVD